MKHFTMIVIVCFTILWTGLTVVPKFCQEHQIKDYCWVHLIDPKGGLGGLVED